MYVIFKDFEQALLRVKEINEAAKKAGYISTDEDYKDYLFKHPRLNKAAIYVIQSEAERIRLGEYTSNVDCSTLFTVNELSTSVEDLTDDWNEYVRQQ